MHMVESNPYWPHFPNQTLNITLKTTFLDEYKPYVSGF